MSFYFRDNGVVKIAVWEEREIYGFCGGSSLYGLSVRPTATGTDFSKEKVYDSFLEGFLATSANVASLHIYDCAGGWWDAWLFNNLPKGMAGRYGGRDYEFILTPFYVNPSSGNSVRSCIIIREFDPPEDDDPGYEGDY